MADLFLSYSPKDVDAVTKLVEALKERGSTVAWERSEALDAQEAARLDNEIAQASWIVVLWSSNALQDGRITFEAMQARDKNNLISVQLEPNSIPADFNNADNPQLQEYQDQLTEILAVALGQAQPAPTEKVAETVVHEEASHEEVSQTQGTGEQAVEHQPETVPASSQTATKSGEKVEEKPDVRHEQVQKSPQEQKATPVNHAAQKAEAILSATKDKKDVKSSPISHEVSKPLTGDLGAALVKAQAHNNTKNAATTKKVNTATGNSVSGNLTNPAVQVTAQAGEGIKKLGEGSGHHSPPTNPMNLTPGAGAPSQTKPDVNLPPKTRETVSSGGHKGKSSLLVPAGLVVAGMTLLGAVGGGYWYMATNPPASHASTAKIKTIMPEKTIIAEKRRPQPVAQGTNSSENGTLAEPVKVASVSNVVTATKPKTPAQQENGEVDPILARVLQQIPVARQMRENDKPKPLSQRVAEASPERGAKFARKCTGCHSFEKGGEVRAGPNLYNVVDQLIGSSKNYEYSDTLRSMGAIGEVWSIEQLECYLTDPERCMPGTHMSFSGIRSPTQRADIIAYMKKM